MNETAYIDNTRSPEQKVPRLSSSQLLSLEILANIKRKEGKEIYIKYNHLLHMLILLT